MTSGPADDQTRGFEAFRALVHASPVLQGELRDVVDVQQFVALAVRRAHEHGVALTPEDVRAAMFAARRTWTARCV